jgi:hypothetical protein
VADLKRQHCTIEEMEEYEPHLDNGTIVYAGIDYAEILEKASRDADVIVWDGGNNDLPFYRPTLHVVVADPLRLGNELTYYPGEANLRMADVVVINKVDTADLAATEELRGHVRVSNADARIVEAASPVMADGAERITGRRVLVVEDGPTLTHGEMRFGAGTVLARKFGAAEIVDPRPFVVGSIGYVRHLPCDWAAASCDGLRRGADSRPRGDDCEGPVRFRHRWHTDRPEPAGDDRQAGCASAVRAARGRKTGLGGCVGAPTEANRERTATVGGRVEDLTFPIVQQQSGPSGHGRSTIA